MFEKVLHKLDVFAGFSLSGSLLSSPLWLGPLTDILQIFTLVIGALVGISAYRLNTVRRERIEEEEDD